MSKILFIVSFIVSLNAIASEKCTYVGGSALLLKCEKCENVKICMGKIECGLEEGKLVYADVVCPAFPNNQCPTADICLEESNSGKRVEILINKSKDFEFKLCDKASGDGAKNSFDYQNRRICQNNLIVPYGGKVGTLPTGAIGTDGATGGTHTGSISQGSGQGGQRGIGCRPGSCPTHLRNRVFQKQ